MNVKSSAKVFIIYLLNSWLSPYGTKVLSFCIQKFSRCIKCLHKMSLELEVFTGSIYDSKFSMAVEIVTLLLEMSTS